MFQLADFTCFEKVKMKIVRRVMGRYFLQYLFVCLTCVFCFSCSSDDNPEPEPEKPSSEDPGFPWEEERTQILSTRDMVLIYGGGAHRTTIWDKEHLSSYVTYKDETGKEHWLFDSYLFLEIHNGKDKMFASGYTQTPANQRDWMDLVDYYFQSKIAVGALDKCIGEAAERIGKPSEKHKIVIGLPEPIFGQKDWGSLKDGIMLDFSSSLDRIDACKWYIDYVRKKFKALKVANIELAGFYWIAEEATNTRTIVRDIAAYLNELKYSFNWIPYFNSDGYNEWKNLRFNYAFLQPNYFFNETVPYSRLDEACQIAIKNGMDMEVEFDENVLSVNNGGGRLYDYMKAFKENNVWNSKRLAYYQGNSALYLLSVSADPSDNRLYHEFCHFIIERPGIK